VLTDHHPYTDKIRCFGMLCDDQFLLCGDEDQTIKCKPPLLNDSLHDGFPLSVVGDCLYIEDLINWFGDFLFSPI
jgi:hypothetical protein